MYLLEQPLRESLLIHNTIGIYERTTNSFCLRNPDGVQLDLSQTEFDQWLVKEVTAKADQVEPSVAKVDLTRRVSRLGFTNDFDDNLSQASDDDSAEAVMIRDAMEQMATQNEYLSEARTSLLLCHSAVKDQITC